MLVIALFAFITALLLPSAAAEFGNAATSYIYGVDFETLLSNQAAQCLRNTNYQNAFIMGYSSDYNGTVRYFATASVTAATKANITAVLYMVPQPKSYKSGVQQFAEFFYVLNHCSPVQKSMWIKVTSPNDWPLNYNGNINFINSIINEATHYGVSVGIYTSMNDWKQITNGYSGMNSAIKLWWKDTFGPGTSGESPPNFNDFRPFGSWSAATVKQFSEDYPWCGMTVNRNVMLASLSSSP